MIETIKEIKKYETLLRTHKSSIVSIQGRLKELCNKLEGEIQNGFNYNI